MIKLCNQKNRRAMRIPRELLVVDSKTIKVGLGRLPCASHKGQKAVGKRNVGLLGNRGELYNVNETTGYKPDLKSCPHLLDPEYILVPLTTIRNSSPTTK
jgi:hypothetical protein